MKSVALALIAILALYAPRAKPLRRTKRRTTRATRPNKASAAPLVERILAPWDWLPQAIFHDATTLPDGSARVVVTWRGDHVHLCASSLRLAPDVRAGDAVSLLVLEDGTASIQRARCAE